MVRVFYSQPSFPGEASEFINNRESDGLTFICASGNYEYYRESVENFNSLQHTQEAIADCICAELLISKHDTRYRKVFNAVEIGLQKTSVR